MFHVPAHKNAKQPAGQLVGDVGHTEVGLPCHDVVKPFNAFDFLIRYETQNCDEEDVVEGFQHLINSGLAWQLQGSYGRTAAALIDAGLCHK